MQMHEFHFMQKGRVKEVLEQVKIICEVIASTMETIWGTLQGLVPSVTISICKKGIKQFDSKGKYNTTKELLQHHQRGCIEPVDVQTMKPTERRRVMMSLMLISQKTYGTHEARQVYKDKHTRD